MNKVRNPTPQKNIAKFKQVLLYILSKKPNIDIESLFNMLYFIDFDYYEQQEKQLMGLTYIKYEDGVIR